MSHWAEVDSSNVVLRVLVGDDEHPDEGYDWLITTFGGRWIKTSYNTFEGQHSEGGVPLRGNFAGVGMIYDEALDVFVMPKPFDSWILNTETFQWEAPTPKPSEDPSWQWNEELLDWVPVSTD